MIIYVIYLYITFIILRTRIQITLFTYAALKDHASKLLTVRKLSKRVFFHSLHELSFIVAYSRGAGLFNKHLGKFYHKTRLIN